MTSAAPLAFMLLCSIGCAGGGDGPACERDEDCASGFCKIDGTCGAGALDAPVDDDSQTPDAPPSGTCTPDHDGSVTKAELPLIAGRMATFRVATNPAFDTTGTALAGNQRQWDLTGQLAGDADRVVALKAPTGTWWAADFPAATYYAPLSAASDLLGVFATSDTKVTLLGVVSPEAGTTKTELTYDPPAEILALPVHASASWTSTSTVSGLAQGIAAFYTEQYASTVDQVGMMKTPYGDFPVLRVATDLTRSSGTIPIATSRTFAWVAECYGSVATVTSQNYEAGAEFNNPAEVRRLVP